VADSELRQFNPDGNFGGDASMVSGALGERANGEVRRAVVRFDLAGQIPAGAIINSVTLRLVVEWCR